MKKFSVLVSILVLVSVVPAFSQTRIATVDIVKVIKGYYRSEQVYGQLKDEENTFVRSFQEDEVDLQKKETEYEDLGKKFQDPTISQAAKDQVREKLQDLQSSIQSLQQNMEKKRDDFMKTFQNEKGMREHGLVDDVQKVVNEYAAAHALDLVFDKSGASASTGSPVLIYTSPAVLDISNEIIARLNAGAPKAPVAPPAGGAPALPVSH